MYRIVTKEALKPTVILYEIEAPMVARKDSMGKVTLLEMFTKNWEITPARDTPSALAATIMPMIPA